MTAPERCCERCGRPLASSTTDWDATDPCLAAYAAPTNEAAMHKLLDCYRVAFERERDLRRRLRAAVVEEREALEAWVESLHEEPQWHRLQEARAALDALLADGDV
jgi:hypothetical protein